MAKFKKSGKSNILKKTTSWTTPADVKNALKPHSKDCGCGLDCDYGYLSLTNFGQDCEKTNKAVYISNGAITVGDFSDVKELVSACCSEGGPVNPCSACESYINETCVSNCLFCESCVNGQCVSNCDVCSECTVNGCQTKDCPPCHTCVNGICVFPCLSCETCDANEQCVSNCGPCEQCTSTGCVSACGPCETCVNGVCMPKVCGECETCVNGVCTSNCDTLCENCVSGVCTPFVTCGDCEECIGGNCAYKCTGCETCVNGQCVSNCPNCYECENGVCVEKCTGLGCPTGCETINPITGECGPGYTLPGCNCQTWGDCGQQGGIGYVRSDINSTSGYCSEATCDNGGFPCQGGVTGGFSCLKNCTTTSSTFNEFAKCYNCGSEPTGFQNCAPSPEGAISLYNPQFGYCRDHCDCVEGYICQSTVVQGGEPDIDPALNKCVVRSTSLFTSGDPVVLRCLSDTCFECQPDSQAGAVDTIKEGFNRSCGRYYKGRTDSTNFTPIYGVKQFCDLDPLKGGDKGYCVECLNNLQCPAGGFCVDNICLCTTDQCCAERFGPYYYYSPAAGDCMFNPDA